MDLSHHKLATQEMWKSGALCGSICKNQWLSDLEYVYIFICIHVYIYICVCVSYTLNKFLQMSV